MEQNLDQFVLSPSAFFGSLLECMQNDYEKHIFPRATVVYHYTSVSGLQGIIGTGRIWATHMYYLNDTTEITYAVDVFHRCLQEIHSFHGRRIIDKFVNGIRERIARKPLPKIFAASFSAKRDALSQWRGYGQAGNSYCLGFNSFRLLAGTQANGVILNVIYSPEIQYDLISCAIRHSLDFYLQNASRPFWNDAFFFESFHYFVMMFLPIIKHPSFHEEEEVRIIWNEDMLERINMDISFRSGAGLLIPFVEFSLEDNSDLSRRPQPLYSLDEILIGPHAYSQLAMQSLRWYLDRRLPPELAQNIRLTRTSIPYRP